MMHCMEKKMSKCSGGKTPEEKKVNTLEQLSILKNSQSAWKVEGITLAQKGLKTLPDLKEFSNLKFLDVSCNRIKQLKFLAPNTSLTTLLVYDNEIESLTEVDYLRKLSILHAQYNLIREVEDCFCNTNRVTEIRLDANRITDISSDAMLHCVALTNLDVSYNMLESIEFTASIPNLMYFSASHNRITSIAPLSKCPKLVDADVSDNRITAYSIAGVGCPVIQRLNLANNLITDLSNIKPVMTLNTLKLSNNSIKELPNLGICFPNLEVLHLSGIAFGSNGDLLGNLQRCEKLRELSVDETLLGTQDASPEDNITRLLTEMPNLLRLNGRDLRNNRAKTQTREEARSNCEQIYGLIEDQLKSLAALTAPIVASMSRSYQNLQDMLARVDEEFQTWSEAAEQSRPQSPGLT